MRVSVNSWDKGYVQNPWDYEVYFNGVLNQHCLTADEELGEVTVYQVDENGKYIPTGNWNINTETLKGEVVIKDIQNANRT